MPKNDFEESLELKTKKLKMLNIVPTAAAAAATAASTSKAGDVSSQNYFIETIIRKFDEKRENF